MPEYEDAALERQLRAVLRDHLDALPLDLSADAVERRRASSRPVGRFTRRRGITLLAAAALVLVGGALAAGSGLLRLTSVVPPAPSAAPLVTAPPEPSATPGPTATPRPEPFVAWIPWGDPGNRIWISREGGRDARKVDPVGAGEPSGRLAWSPDGSQVLYWEGPKLFLAGVNGGERRLIDTGCVAPCAVDTDAAFSPDGTKIVFARQTADANGNVVSAAVATMDLASGRVDVLASTASNYTWWPSWSPDGQRISFTAYGEGDLTALFVVDQDGENMHRVSPKTLAAGYGEWSPDGSRIVFWTPDFISGRGRTKDIYTIRPDGTDLRQLTSDGFSSAASWTADGRILFAKNSLGDGGPRGVSFWTMDADGTNAAMFVPADVVRVGDDEFPTVSVVSQPLGGPAIPAAQAPGSPGIAVGPPPPTPTPPPLDSGFSWTGSVDTAAQGPLGETATLLADGRVLFVGGCDVRAQLYDPGTGTFSPTGSLSVARGRMTATLLRDGRVLVTGGYACAGGDGTWASAELYDPRTGTFSPTGSMAVPRAQHTATLLQDGRVLIAGGSTGSSATAGGVTLASYRTAAVDPPFLTTAELYDPTTGTFHETGSMHAPHRGHTATLLLDGRVLVVGNGGESTPPGKAADLYDPATGTFTKTGSMATGRTDHTATLLEDGRVLILGGANADDTSIARGELYDAETGTFRSAGPMAHARSGHTAARLSDGRLLIVGGFWNDGDKSGVLSAAELFDPGTGDFSPIGSSGTARANHTATLLQDGRVLIAGGQDPNWRGSVVVVSAVLYQP